MHVGRGLPVDDRSSRRRRPRTPRRAAPGARPSGARRARRRARAPGRGARSTISAPDRDRRHEVAVHHVDVDDARAGVHDRARPARRGGRSRTARIEGATRTSCRSSGLHGAGDAYHVRPPRPRLCRRRRRVLGPVLLAVVDLVERGDVPAARARSRCRPGRTGRRARGRGPRRSGRGRPRRRGRGSGRGRCPPLSSSPSGSPIAVTSMRESAQRMSWPSPPSEGHGRGWRRSCPHPAPPFGGRRPCRRT